MTAKEHYDTHLGNFYSWMIGDFTLRSEEQQSFFIAHNILPQANKSAVDLGCGSGIQAIALARLGFEVAAIDFNRQLLEELKAKAAEFNIKIFEMDLMTFDSVIQKKAGLFTCMGDTITHLDAKAEVERLFKKIYDRLDSSGKFVVSFRDLSMSLRDGARFIPVKSDENRILTCFLEYFDDYVNVTDLLHEKGNGTWIQKVGSYKKLRISNADMERMLTDAGFLIESCESINRMTYIVGRKAEK